MRWAQTLQIKKQFSVIEYNNQLDELKKIEEEILQMAYECHIFKVKKGDAKTYSYQYQSITEKITCELKDYIVERTGMFQ